MSHSEGAASRLIVRNAAVRTAGEIGAKLASVVFFVAIARELGERSFGDFAFALSFTTVLLIAAGFGTEELVAREVARERGRIHDLLSNVIAMKAAMSVVLLLVAAAVVNVAGYPSDVRVAVYLIGAGVAVENLARSWHSVFQGYERMEFISLGLIAQRFTTAVAGVVVLALGGTLVAVSATFLGGCLVGLAVAMWAMRRYLVRPRIEIDRARWWPLARAGIPIGIVTLLLTTLLKLDQTLISFLAGGNEDNSEVGFYGAAFRLVEATLFIGWSFSDAMLPWLARQQGDPTRLARGYELGLKAIGAVLVPIGIGFVLFAEPLIDLLYGDNYEEAVDPLRLLGATVVFSGVNYMASITLIARDRPGRFARAVGVVVVANVVMNVILIPPYGAVGAAISASVSGLALTLMSLWMTAGVAPGLRPLRAFGGPLAGGLGMTAAVLGTGLPFVPAVVVGALGYALCLLAFERLFFPDDLARVRSLLRRAARTAPHETPATTVG
jgi:O-antigen/teichoic acid export membrane protein